MKIYVFGNNDHDKDNVAFEVMRRLVETQDFASLQIEFIVVKPNEDLPFEGDVIIMDGIENLKEVTLITDIDKFDLGPKNSVHDFDLSFQLKYLKKLGKIKSVKIIGLPLEGKVEIKKVEEIIDKLINLSS